MLKHVKRRCQPVGAVPLGGPSAVLLLATASIARATSLEVAQIADLSSWCAVSKMGLQNLGRMISLACRLGELVMARQRIELAAEEAEELSRRARATTVPVRDRQRAEIILLSVQGLTQQRIAEQLGISRLSVNRWVGALRCAGWRG
jgi:DNA-directed RNA polymerase specialized sigma24 family protein